MQYREQLQVILRVNEISAIFVGLEPDMRFRANTSY